MEALLAQLAPAPGHPEANLASLEGALRAHPEVELAVFPELFMCGYEPERAEELSCPAEGALIGRVRTAARASGTAVVVGFAERTASGRAANAAACIDRDGRLAGVYRKTHLFAERERQAFVAGDRLLLTSLCGRRVGPLICFDVEFPEPARELSRGGAELLITIAANMAPYGADHELATRARALENRRAHLYVNRVGAEGELRFVGESRAIAADGCVRSAAGAEQQMLVVEVPEGGTADGEVDYLKHARDGLALEVVPPAGTRQGE
jgi:(R)-amidase